MKRYTIIFSTVLMILLAQIAMFGQGLQKKVVINWKGVQAIQGINYETIKALSADGLTNNAAKNYTPEYFEKFVLPANAGGCDIIVTHTEWEPITDAQLNSVTYPLQPTETLSPVIENRHRKRRKNGYAYLSSCGIKS
jgi:hypothetical protein